MANDSKTQRPTLTTAAGIPVGDNQNSLTAGPRGPLLVQDWQLFEKHAHFNRERIPERVVHAKGSAALRHPHRHQRHHAPHQGDAVRRRSARRPRCCLRFSTVAGEKGAADAERDVRGFALKFYTEEGNWDLVGNNTPVFFVRDPYKFPDFIHTQKRDPRTNLRNADRDVGFLVAVAGEPAPGDDPVLRPRPAEELPADARFRLAHLQLHQCQNERVWVKFHFKSLQGIANISEARIRQHHRRRSRKPPARPGRGHRAWRVPALAHDGPADDARIRPKRTAFDPFDLTKVWPHEDFPLVEVGILELNRNPENYFAEVEQASFSPANVVPGISHSPDKMLQFRVFSYADAHRYRLGVELREPAGQRAALPGPQLSPRRRHALRRQ